jgi:ubiquinone/menaquinone biosynthesis C-methylase UbiE
MVHGDSRPYAIHSAEECERLERQAPLAGLEDHLRHVPVRPGARILDVGCGSGCMTRLFAARYKDSNVVGLDLRADYLDYARYRAAQEGLANIEFREGDACQLLFPDDSFDLVWSKYLLQWVAQPETAIGEFRRVARKGACVVTCTFDGFALTHWPEDSVLQREVELVFPALVDPFIGRKMPSLFMANGLTNIEVAVEHDRVFTVIGSIDPERRRNWSDQLTAARPSIAKILGVNRRRKRSWLASWPIRIRPTHVATRCCISYAA